MDELKDFAVHEFGLAAPNKGGGSLRSHLLSIKRQTGKTPQGLVGPSRPAGSDMLWRMFLDLSASRQWSDWGQPMPILYQEIEAWSRVNSYRVSFNDLALLRMLDSEYRRIIVEAASKSSGSDDDDWSVP